MCGLKPVWAVCCGRRQPNGPNLRNATRSRSRSRTRVASAEKVARHRSTRRANGDTSEKRRSRSNARSGLTSRSGRSRSTTLLDERQRSRSVTLLNGVSREDEERNKRRRERAERAEREKRYRMNSPRARGESSHGQLRRRHTTADEQRRHRRSSRSGSDMEKMRPRSIIRNRSDASRPQSGAYDSIEDDSAHERLPELRPIVSSSPVRERKSSKPRRRSSRSAAEVALKRSSADENLRMRETKRRSGYQHHSTPKLVAAPMSANVEDPPEFNLQHVNVLADIARRENALQEGFLEVPAPESSNGSSARRRRRSTITVPAPQPKVDYVYEETALIPKTEAEHRQFLAMHTSIKGLRALIPSNSPRLISVSSRAAISALQITKSFQMSPYATTDLETIGLYDVVVFCDDSTSMMEEGRWDTLHTVVGRIARLASCYNTDGISLRFINYRNDVGFNGISTYEQVDTCLGAVSPMGMTNLGTMLFNKVILPLIVRPAQQGELRRPVIVSIVTDGEPNEEDERTLRNSILACKNELRKLGLGSRAAVFQITRVGRSTQAKRFLARLKKDEDIRGLLFCTDVKVDDALGRAKNEGELNTWLTQLLAGAVKR